MCLHLEALNGVVIICSDHHNKGCTNKLGKFSDPKTAEAFANRGGWYKDKQGNWSCPQCSQKVNRDIHFD